MTIKSQPSVWEQWAECDTCHAQTPVFAVSANDNRLFDYMRDHKWKRYFPPWAKTHADEMIMCGECIRVLRPSCRQPECACGERPGIYRFGLTDDNGVRHTWEWCARD